MQGGKNEQGNEDNGGIELSGENYGTQWKIEIELFNCTSCFNFVFTQALLPSKLFYSHP